MQLVKNLLCFSALVWASPFPSSSSSRYLNGTGTFLTAPQNGSPYAAIPVQAIGGKLIFTNDHPRTICPCKEHQFGVHNYTGYASGKEDTLLLYTSSPLPQYVYVGRDLIVRYTLPGEPVPEGANATSITFNNDQPLGGGLPSESQAAVQGTVRLYNGTEYGYDTFIFCAPAGSPAGTVNGQGPLEISVANYTTYKPPSNCITQAIFNTINDPAVAPYYYVFRAPQEPLVFAYA